MCDFIDVALKKCYYISIYLRKSMTHIEQLSQSCDIQFIDNLIKEQKDSKFLMDFFYSVMAVDNVTMFSHLFENYATILRINKKEQANIFYYIIDHQAINIIRYFFNSPLYQVDTTDRDFYCVIRCVIRSYRLARSVFDLLVMETPLFNDFEFQQKLFDECSIEDRKNIEYLLTNFRIKHQLKSKLEKDVLLHDEQPNFKL